MGNSSCRTLLRLVLRTPCVSTEPIFRPIAVWPDRPEPSYCGTGHVNVPADANRATTNYLFGPGGCGNSFATAASAWMAALKNVGAAAHGRPFVVLFSDLRT